MRYGFVTCVEIGLSCMRALYETGLRLDLAVTLLDEKASNKSGRVYIDQFCDKNKIPLEKCSHINDQHIIDEILNKDIDWLFIIGWSQIANDAVLEAPKCGVLGMHPTLLPVGRGRAAVPWAIIKGLEKTGVSLFKLDSGVDTGMLGSQYEIMIEPDEDATSLYEKVNDAHYRLMKSTVIKLETGDLEFVTQDESKATEWSGRKPEDGKINLNGSVVDAERLVRGVTHPYPGAFIEMEHEKIIVWKAAIVKQVTVDIMAWLKTNRVDQPTIRFYDGFLKLLEWSIEGTSKNLPA